MYAVGLLSSQSGMERKSSPSDSSSEIDLNCELFIQEKLMLLSCGAKVSFIPIEICNLKESTSRSAYKMDSSIFIKEQQLWQSHMHKALGPFLLRAPCLRVLLLWDNKFMAETLIEAFVEFVGKLIPALSEPLLTNFKNKWLPFREILTKQQPHEALRYVQSMSFVRTNPVPLNYVPESGMKAVKVNDTNESPPNRRLTIETNSNRVYVKRPSYKGELALRKEQSTIDTDVLSRTKCEDFVHPKKRVGFAVSRNLLALVEETVQIFKKDSQTIKQVYERSHEIDTPQTPQTFPQTLEAHGQRLIPMGFHMLPQHQGLLRRYSIYAPQGFIQPVQLDYTFQQYQQHHQNKVQMKKLYF